MLLAYYEIFGVEYLHVCQKGAHHSYYMFGLFAYFLNSVCGLHHRGSQSFNSTCKLKNAIYMCSFTQILQLCDKSLRALNGQLYQMYMYITHSNVSNTMECIRANYWKIPKVFFFLFMNHYNTTRLTLNFGFIQ